MKKLVLYILFICAAFCTACDTSENEATLSESFFKVYDNSTFDASFIPIDVQQTASEGYLILSSSRLSSTNFTGVNLIMVDKEGEFIREEVLSEEYVNPVNQLIKINDQYFFMAMNAVNLQATLFQITDSARIVSTTPIGGLTYPMYLNQDGENLLALSYNNQEKVSVLSVLTTEGAIFESQGYTIGAGPDTEAPIISHFTRTGKQLPFFAGKVSGGSYFFNGFFNYTLSLVFTNFGDEPLGVVQGQQDDGGFSSGVSVAGANFAASRFNFGENYIIPSVDLNTTGISSTTDIDGNPFPELVPDAPVVLKLVDVSGQQVILYGSSTKSGQIILMAFDAASGVLNGTKYLGSTYPYEISGFTSTSDGGLVVVGNTSVAGRFDRICMFKLSASELSGLAN
ncbi:hypothetical protein [Fulvivirga lutea]|uniref:Uncharacterized protein n=1 Tax=Fulvivirga lutea TaxID=2810512 RepID=A0A974WGL0_9BACT|nr:hypothetical protein [Fulvivirga lutea]QSE96707.1 hypothetical protein JR347_14035 [Fulvivirga lutea]